MSKFVQAFFLIFIKTIFFFIFFPSCKTNQFISNSYSSCLKNHILPNPTMFDYSPLSSTLLQPVCEIFYNNQNFFPHVVDGLSFSTLISIPLECIFEESLIPKQIISPNANIVLWDYTHNIFLDFWILYKPHKPCGMIILPKSKYLDSSFYFLIIKKTFFINFIKNDYKKDINKHWDNFKTKNTLNDLTSYQINLIKSIIESYKNLYSFYPDDSVYTVFPIRSINGLFAPFLHYLEKRKEQITIDIFNQIHLKDYIPKKEGNVYKLQFREKILNSHPTIHIFYGGIGDLNYPIKLEYDNTIYVYIPQNIDKKYVNIILVNGNIIKLPSFRLLAQESNSIIISYFIFKNPFLNFVNDILIYENIHKIIGLYLKEFNIHRIYKICIQDKECIISTFYEPKIQHIISYDIPLLKSDGFNYNEIKLILNTLNFSDGEMILKTFSKQIKEDILDYSLYMKYKHKLMDHLNYNFKIHEFNFSIASYHIYDILNIIKK